MVYKIEIVDWSIVNLFSDNNAANPCNQSGAWSWVIFSMVYVKLEVKLCTHCNSLSLTCFPWGSQLLSIIQLTRQCDSCYNLFTQDNSSSPESSIDFITSVWMQQHIWQCNIYVSKDFTKLTSHLSVLARFSKWVLNLSLTYTICVLHDLYSMFNDQLHSAHVLV